MKMNARRARTVGATTRAVVALVLLAVVSVGGGVYDAPAHPAEPVAPAAAAQTDLSGFRAAPFSRPGWGTDEYNDQESMDQVGMEEEEEPVQSLPASAPAGLDLGLDSGLDLGLGHGLVGQAAGDVGLGLPAAGLGLPPTVLLNKGGHVHDVSTGAGTTVAILDTGILPDHPTLKGLLVDPADYYDFVDDDASPWEIAPTETGTSPFGATEADADGVYGHGTFVAGLVHLIAPDADLMPLRVLDPWGVGDPGAIADAINFAADHGADVINLSVVRDTEAAAVTDAIADVTADGVLVVVPAGNHGDGTNKWPASDDCALAVTGLNSASKRATFAGHGLHVDVSAPAVDLVSTLPTESDPDANGFGEWQGTSFAAPFVAAQAALLKALDASLSPWELTAIIAATADSVDALNGGLAGELGVGLPQMRASVDYVTNGDPILNTLSLLAATCG